MIKIKIIVLLGKSGSGKNVLCEYLQELGIQKLVTHTTRKPRQGEINGVAYHFVTKEDFDKLNKIEQTEYAGDYYGLSRQEIEKCTSEISYIIMDYNGAKKIKENYNDTTIIYIHIDQEQQEERLRKRGDSEDEIKKRINYSIQSDEVKNDIEIADYIITNNDLEKSKQILKYIVKDVLNEKVTVF